MNRRTFLRASFAGVISGGALEVAGVPGSFRGASRVPGLQQERIEIPGTLRKRAFDASSGDDARYHALVYEGGGAAGKSLITTPVSDGDIARRLRALGAEDGGGVPMGAWNLRRIPLLGAPRSRVRGSPVRISVEWEDGGGPRDFGSLLEDPGGRGVAFRFGGNEEHDDAWESGCIACLFSCPGGVVSNERYTIRDHLRNATRFSAVPDLPDEDTPVMLALELLPIA